MIDWLKNNWKTAIVGLAVAVVILSLLCCNGDTEGELITPVDPTTVEDVAPVLEPAKQEE